MKTPIEFNINNYVRVKLTPAGRQVYETAIRTRYAVPMEKDRDGYYKFQMWELMRIFGPTMHHGMQIPFEKNAFTLEVTINVEQH